MKDAREILMDNMNVYDTYDDVSDSFVERYINSERKEFYHQWNSYISDDSMSYDSKELLNNLINMSTFL